MKMGRAGVSRQAMGDLVATMEQIDKSWRLALPAAALAASGVLLSGCLAGPTYGTAKGSNQQLIEDVTGVLSIGPKDKEQIDYKPRPELVKPADVANAPLPAPQDSVTTASNGAWPESPEQRLRRIRTDATANRDEIGFEPEIASAAGSEPALTPQQRFSRSRGDDVKPLAETGGFRSQRADFNRRLALSNQGSPTTRRFLSEPPLAYRQPSETATVGDIGEDEWKKEKRQKNAARKKGTGGWRELVPWL